MRCFFQFSLKDNRVQVWKNRIENFFRSNDNPDGDYQSNQAKIAISTGGLFGKAPGKSTQRNMLPQSNSDFIFAIIIEEYGLLFGAIPLILAYMILLFRGITIAKKCETAFPAFLVLGLDCNDCNAGNAEYACCCRIIPGNRTDTADGKLGKDFGADDELFNRSNIKCQQGGECKDKE